MQGVSRQGVAHGRATSDAVGLNKGARCARSEGDSPRGFADTAQQKSSAEKLGFSVYGESNRKRVPPGVAQRRVKSAYIASRCKDIAFRF